MEMIASTLKKLAFEILNKANGRMKNPGRALDWLIDAVYKDKLELNEEDMKCLCAFTFQASRGTPHWQSKATRLFDPKFLHWALEVARQYLDELLTSRYIALPDVRVRYTFTTTPTSATGAVFFSEEDNFIFALAQVMRDQLGNLRRCANPACRRIFRVKRGDQKYHKGGCGGLFRMRKSRGTPPERYGVLGRPSSKGIKRCTKLKKGGARHGTKRRH
jgi:hypothetical protein